MRLKLLFIISVCFLLSSMGYSQVSDNFNDGDFTANPAWVGNAADWTVNSALQLQSNNMVTNSTYFLSTASTLATAAQWEFYTQITFNPSSANYIDVYLTASASDISLNTTTGYFVRIGNTDDEISLYRKNAGGAIVKIIDGVNGVLNTSNNVMKIKVFRNAANQWNLSRDLSGTGNSYFNEGVVTDATYLTSSYFGILIKQSTASFFQRHFFDDIEITAYVPDIVPPVIVSATAISTTAVDVLFNEPVELASSQVLSNYIANNGIGMPATVVRDAVNAALVHLTFASAFANGTIYQLTVNAVTDLSGNAISNGTANFSFYTPKVYDIVIDEIMADPSPQVALPDNEWIELRNTSAFPINVLGWRIGDNTGQSGTMPAFVLQPDSFVIVCTGSAVAAMSVYGNVITVTSFPSLDNGGDQISLFDASGNIIHSVDYSDKWYQNELKKAGGWTMEMIDTKNPCNGFSNWIASNDANGGTPGKKNSVDGVNADDSSPRLLRAYATDSVNVVLVFDEPVDITKAAVAANYNISDAIATPQTANALAPVFNKVALKLNVPLLRNKVYSVTVSAITDCVGNVISADNTAKLGLASSTDSFDVVINEILFNPISTGVDYVELYNRTNKVIDLKNMYIANRNSAGVISSIAQLSSETNLLYPQDFIVVTSDASVVKRDFITKNPDAFVEVSMPSFNDDNSNVIILNEQGKIVDELFYSDKWHFKLLDNKEGVALERIDYDAPTQNQDNWHSAATSVGYGTPTYKNSQYRIDMQVQGDITVSPEIVSPDNDGMDDYATIDYNFPSPGYVANITIFDANGRLVRYLQRSALCGIKGSFRWDGLGEKFQKLPVGIYIIYTEVFNLDGKKKQFKNTIVLARRN
ncbi:MAG TPA: lamin tail domain-containing protein [Ferruginibacter sp.]|nr:lamin tail domain-containing protein [Ferruginibacter sp.]